MLTSRATYLVVVAVLVVALVGILVLTGKGSSQQHGFNRQKATGKWKEFVEAGVRENSPSDAHRWPFSSAVRARPMPLQLRSEAYAVLGKPKDLGLRFDDARHAIGQDGAGLWVVPGRDVICMFPAEEVGAACRTDHQAERHGLLLQTYKTRGGESHQLNSYAVIGLAPDGIKKVRMKFGKTWRTMPVHHNVYTAEAEVPIGVAPVNSVQRARTHARVPSERRAQSGQSVVR